MAGFRNDVIYGTNIDLSGSSNPLPTLVSDGQLLIASTALNGGGTHVNVGTMSAANPNITIGYSSPNITVDAPIKFYQPGWANIGILQSAGTTFSIVSEDGSSFTSSNPGFVALQSLAHPGRIIRYSIAASQSFTQAQLGNNLFDVTTAVDITVDIPFYLYAVSNSNNGANTIAFMISRIPHATISPVAGKIAQSGNTNATTQGSFFSLATITAADYASSPCLCIGSFRMRYASSLWTIQTLNNSDGIGQFNDSTKFSFPRGQFGAASGKLFLNNGGTAPDDTAGTYFYFILKSGYVTGALEFPSVTTSGVGINVAKMALPFVTSINAACLSGYHLDSAFSSYDSCNGDVVANSKSTNVIIIMDFNAVAGYILKNANVLTGDIVSTMISYQASTA